MIWVLLPAYNEEGALEPLLGKIAAAMKEWSWSYRVVVVNDGSGDRTGPILADLAARFPLDAITHRYNRGLGETIRDGLEWIVDRAGPDDVVVRMDCDDTHDPIYIRALVAELNRGCEVVTCSRYVPDGAQIGVNLYRRTISRCANLLLKVCFPIAGLQEYTCGYRAYRTSLIRDALAIYGNAFIDLKGMGFTGTIEKIVKCSKMGARVGEIPFVLRYDRKQGPSKVLTSLTTLGYLVLIAKYIYPWGELGKAWRRQCAERRRRVYGPDGLRPLPPVAVD